MRWLACVLGRLPAVRLTSLTIPPPPFLCVSRSAGGDEIEIRPGIVSRDASGAMKSTPILSRVLSLYAEKNDLEVRAK